MKYCRWSLLIIWLVLCVFPVRLTMAQSEPQFGQVWHKNPENPVFLNPGDTTWNLEEQLNVGTNLGQDILWNGDQYMLYVSGNNGGVKSIGLFTGDTITGPWTEHANNPILAPADSFWATQSVCSPRVILDNGTYKMWFAGRSAETTDYRIGYAESSDGITWVPHPDSVLSVTPATAWDSERILDLYVIKRGEGDYIGWYTGGSGTLNQIGCVTSTDGINWSRVSTEPVISAEAPTPNWVRNPVVNMYDGHYVMWYSGGSAIHIQDGHGRIFTAISEDGITWRKDDLYNPVLQDGATGTWDDWFVGVLQMFLREDHYEMIYVGVGDQWTLPSVGTATYKPTLIPGGIVEGTWTKEGSPYLVQGEITIDDGYTLSIEAGTTVEFLEPGHLKVGGRLLALGTEDERIRFRVPDTLGFYDWRDTTSTWQGIWFDSTSATNDSSFFRYCDFEFAKSDSNGKGGAMFVDNFTKLSIEHCLFQHNRATRTIPEDYAVGGAILLDDGASPIIRKCVFQYNRAEHYGDDNTFNSSGGAIMATDGSNPKILDNVFRWNSAQDLGGAIGIWFDSYPYLENNLIVENLSMGPDLTGGVGGGVAFGEGSYPVFMNNTIANNSSYGRGGGVYVIRGSARIINTIIADNTRLNAEERDDYDGFQVGIWNNSLTDYTLQFYHSCVEWGIDSIMVSDADYGRLSFINCTDLDPALDTDYRLTEASAVMCGGVDTITIGGTLYEAPEVDLDGNPRPNPPGSLPDIGCYESSIVNVEQRGRLPSEFKLSQNYPNPFNPSTTISYELPQASEVMLTIYDVKGAVVASIDNGRQSRGNYAVEWHGRDATGRQVSTGIYLCRLVAGDYSQTIKMVLLR